MNFAWLDDFLVLAESGNFSRAADERHVTQPAFSRRIRALEEWLGTELVDRSSQPAELTEAGRWFQGVARVWVGQLARLPGEARAVAEAHATTLRFAATHALSFTFLPGWLRGLEARVEVGAVRLMSDVLARCEALLLERQVQFVLAHAHAALPDRLQAAGCPWIRVGDDALLAVSAPDAEGRPRHAPATTAPGGALPVLRYSPESGLGRLLDEVHGADLARTPAEAVFTAHLASVLRTMTLDGRGLAWLPRALVADDLAQGRLVEAAPAWNIDLAIRLYRDAAALGPAGEAFWAAAGGA